MMHNHFATLDDDISRRQYGGKAEWIYKLHQHGCNVPDSVFLPAVSISQQEYVSEKIIEQALRKLYGVQGEYPVAIRSSAVAEDHEGQSMAGHFETFLGTLSIGEAHSKVQEIFTSAQDVLPNETDRFAVLIQKKIEPAYSGVLFTSNPVNGSRSELFINYTSGYGVSLVSGDVEGEEVIIPDTGNISLSDDVPSKLQSHIPQIREKSKYLERHYGYPLDIEWCVEENTDRFFYLQCRPDTGTLLTGPKVIKVTRKNEDIIPKYVLGDDKVQLRLDTEDRGLKVSDGYLVVVDCNHENTKAPDLSTIEPSRKCKAYSAVLLHPRQVDGETIRSFLPYEMNIPEFIGRCQRYLVRSYPDYDSLTEHIEDIVDLCCDGYWNPILIVQEIYDPTFTGIIRKVDESYVIEIGYGHFVPKGIVETSRYVLSEEYEIISQSTPSQESRYRILDGYVLEEKLEEEREATVEKKTLTDICKSLGVLLDGNVSVVEFGLLENGAGYEPFIIDLVEESKNEEQLSVEESTAGIISSGTVNGVLTDLRGSDDMSALDTHFHDVSGSGEGKRSSKIFLAQRPTISLLDLLSDYDPSQVGFIFESGSLLCHLAVILREKGIPAMILSEDQDLDFGKEKTLRASANVSPSKRLS